MTPVTTMTLFGGPISPFVRKVGICILEKGLEGRVRRVRAPTAMVKANLQLMQHNPLSKIPVLLTEGGQALYDSNVICDYLDATFPGGMRLIPQAGTERWRSLCWTALASGMLDALVLWRFERNRPPVEQSQATLATYQLKMQRCFDHVEQVLPEIEAAEYGLSQITLGCMFGYCDFRFADVDWRSGHRRSADWYLRFCQRESSRRTEPFEDDRFRPGVDCGGLEPFWAPTPP